MSSRLQAIGPLFAWLKRGGPCPPATQHAESPPLLHLSDAVAFAGDEGNVKLVATKRLEKGHFVMGVARSSCLHARSEALSPARAKQVEAASAAIRLAAEWKTPLVDAADTGRLECIVLLALELLDGEKSAWAPYLQSLPSAQHAAPPSLWALHGEAVAAELLLDTSIGALVAIDQREVAAIAGPLAPPPAASDADCPDAAAAAADETRDTLHLAATLGVAPSVSEEAARSAFAHAIGLVVTRLISGVGLVPLFDLLNGAPTGEHNATIERSNLAASASAKEEAPCCAALASRTIEEGEEILLAYGELSAGQFLYKYGWLPGGDLATSGATSVHDEPQVGPAPPHPPLALPFSSSLALSCRWCREGCGRPSRRHSGRCSSASS